jgi:hypothetical protein
MQRGTFSHRHLLVPPGNQISYKRIKISVLRLVSHEVTLRTWDAIDIAGAGG